MTLRRASVLAALAATAVSLPASRGGFVIDDAYLVVDNPALRSLASIPRFFVQPWAGGAGSEAHARVNAAYFRPLTTTLQAFEYAVFGLHPVGWHLTSILLHALATALATLLIGRFAGSRAALIGGLLFAVHPVHTEAIAAVSYQTTLLAAVLAIAALVVFGRILTEGPRPARLVGVALLAAGAAAAKEEAVVVPLMAATWALIARAPRWSGAAGAMATAVAAFLVLRALVVTGSGVTYFAGHTSTTVALTMVRVAALYVELLVLPLRLCPFYDWFIVPPETGLTPMVALGLATIAALAAAIVIARRHVPAAAIGLAWIPVGLIPVLHLIPILNVAAERFLYLPSLGFAMAIGALCDRLPRRATAVAAIAFTLLAARTLIRWPDWRDDRALNEATARDFPETPTPLLNLADLDLRHSDVASATTHLQEAARRAPGWSVPLQRLGRLPSTTTPPR